MPLATGATLVRPAQGARVPNRAAMARQGTVLAAAMLMAVAMALVPRPALAQGLIGAPGAPEAYHGEVRGGGQLAMEPYDRPHLPPAPPPADGTVPATLQPTLSRLQTAGMTTPPASPVLDNATLSDNESKVCGACALGQALHAACLPACLPLHPSAGATGTALPPDLHMCADHPRGVESGCVPLRHVKIVLLLDVPAGHGADPSASVSPGSAPPRRAPAACCIPAYSPIIFPPSCTGLC